MAKVIITVPNGSGLSPIEIPHNELDGLQGGQTGEYYHLTEEEHTLVTTPQGLQEVTDIGSEATIATPFKVTVTDGIDKEASIEATLTQVNLKGSDDNGETNLTVSPSGILVDNRIIGSEVFPDKTDEDFAQLGDIKNVYVTPEQFGAIGDGIADDTEEVQDALNSGKQVVFINDYLVTTLDLPTRANLLGFSDSKIISASNSPMITVNEEGTTINGLTFIGSGKDSGLTSQTAIQVSGDDGEKTIITNCRFENIGGSAYENFDQGDRQTGTVMTDCFILDSNRAIYLHDEGEYNSFSNIVIDGCNIGFSNSSGNNSFTGGSIINCGTNVYLGIGNNDGHSVMQGTMVNHGVNYNVFIEDTLRGYLFNGCMFYDGDIFIEDSNFVKFIGCDFALLGNTMTINSVGFTSTQFFNNKFQTFGTYVETGNTPIWIGNTFQNQQSPFVGKINSLVNTINQSFGVGTNTPDIFASYSKSIGIGGAATSALQINGGTTSAHINMGVAGTQHLFIRDNNTSVDFTTTGLPMNIGTSDSNIMNFRANGTTIGSIINGIGLGLTTGLSLQNNSSANIFRQHIGTTSASAFMSRNTADAYRVMNFNLIHASSTANSIVGFQSAGVDRYTLHPSGTPTNATDLITKAVSDLKAPLASPTFTGNVQVPTATTTGQAVPFEQMNTALGDYISLAGTGANTITGDLEFQKLGDKSIFKNTDVIDTGLDIRSEVFFPETGGVSISSLDNDTGYATSINVQSSIVQVNSSDPTSKGIISTSLFDKQNDPNTFKQMGDSFLKYTTTEILALTPTSGDVYYNTTLNVVVYYDGTTWQKLSFTVM